MCVYIWLLNSMYHLKTTSLFSILRVTYIYMMSVLAMTEARLPPGFRFHPRDDELVCDYLVKSACIYGGGSGCHRMLVEVDLNKCEPWDLPEMARVGGREEWYFLSLRDRKYATGQRTNRTTESGYWKATGKDRAVSRRGVVVGMRKTLVFYQGRAPRGTKAQWVMHEFRLVLPAAAAAASLCDPNVDHPLKLSSFEEGRVLCRVFCKSISGRATSKPTAEEEEQQQQEETSSSHLPPLIDPATSELLGYQQQQQQVSCFSNLSNPLRSAHQHVGGLASSSSPSSSSDKLVSSVLSYFTTNSKGDEVRLPSPCFTRNALPSMWCNPARYFG